MCQDDCFIVQSLELHLFFARIMKKQSFFPETGSAPADAAFAREGEFFKQAFEQILCRAITLGNGIVRPEVVRSGEFLTEFTARAGRQTQAFTGIPIDQCLTTRTARLHCGENRRLRPELFRQVHLLHRTALRLLDPCENELIDSADALGQTALRQLRCP